MKKSGARAVGVSERALYAARHAILDYVGYIVMNKPDLWDMWCQGKELREKASKSDQATMESLVEDKVYVKVKLELAILKAAKKATSKVIEWMEMKTASAGHKWDDSSSDKLLLQKKYLQDLEEELVVLSAINRALTLDKGVRDLRKGEAVDFKKAPDTGKHFPSLSFSSLPTADSCDLDSHVGTPSHEDLGRLTCGPQGIQASTRPTQGDGRTAQKGRRTPRERRNSSENKPHLVEREDPMPTRRNRAMEGRAQQTQRRPDQARVGNE